MAVSHRLGVRNALEFITFPLGTSAQQVSTLRLPLNNVEEMAANAHAATCIFLPPDLDDEPQAWSLSPAFVLTAGEDTPAVNPSRVTTSHSAGTNQSVAKLRAIEVQLDSRGEGTGNNILHVIVNLGGGGESFEIGLQQIYSGKPASFVFTMPAGGTLLDVFLESNSLYNAEIRIFAIGDAP